MHHHHSCCCDEPGGQCCSGLQLFGVTPQYAGTDENRLRMQLVSSRSHSGTAYLRYTSLIGQNCFEVGSFSYNTFDAFVDDGTRCTTGGNIDVPGMSTPHTYTTCGNDQLNGLNPFDMQGTHFASSLYAISQSNLNNDVFTVSAGGGGPNTSGLGVFWRMRADGTQVFRFSGGPESLTWNETFSTDGFITRTINATAQVEVLRLPGGFPNGVRISAQWQTSLTVDDGAQPGPTSTSGTLFVQALIQNLVPCEPGASALFVPPPVPPPDPSMLPENRIIPPTDPAIQEYLEQQARGGGCRGCGDGNNF